MEAGGGRWAGLAKKGTQEKQEGGEKTGGLGWGHGPRAQGVAREDTQQTGASRCPAGSIPGLARPPSHLSSCVTGEDIKAPLELGRRVTCPGHKAGG